MEASFEAVLMATMTAPFCAAAVVITGVAAVGCDTGGVAVVVAAPAALPPPPPQATISSRQLTVRKMLMA